MCNTGIDVQISLPYLREKMEEIISLCCSPVCLSRLFIFLDIDTRSLSCKLHKHLSNGHKEYSD